MTDVAVEPPAPAHRGGAVDLLDGDFTDATEHRVQIPDDPKPEPMKVAAKAKGALVLIKLPPRLPDGWDRDLGGAPDDGKALWTLGLDPRGAGWLAVETVWRNTRFLNCGVWQVRGFWAIRNSGGTPLPFAPIAWRAA